MTITLEAPKTKTALNRMAKAALLEYATQACMLEHMSSEEAAALTKPELVQEVLDVQLQMEVFAEHQAGATGEQVVVKGSHEETHSDGKPITVVGERSDGKAKPLNAEQKAARPDLVVVNPDGGACGKYACHVVTSEGQCNLPAGTGAKYGIASCTQHTARFRTLVKDGMTVEDARVEAAAMALLNPRPGSGKRYVKDVSTMDEQSTSIPAKKAPKAKAKAQAKKVKEAVESKSTAVTPKLTKKQKEDALYTR